MACRLRRHQRYVGARGLFQQSVKYNVVVEHYKSNGFSTCAPGRAMAEIG